MKKILITLLILILSLTTEAQTSVVKIVDSLLIQGNYQRALEILKKESPETIEKHDRIASIYQAIGNYTKAIEFYKKALKIKETTAIKAKLGNSYTAAGLPLDAIKIYEEIIKKDSTNLLVANSLGKLYLTNKKTKKALKIYEYLKKKDTLNPNYPYQLAVALGRQKQLFKMGNNYLEAYKRDTLHIKSIYRIAKFFKDLRFRDSTMIFIDKGLKIDRNNINFNQMKANALYTSKDYQGSLKYLSRLDSLGFKSVNMYELFGLCYLKTEKDSLSEKYFKKALAINFQNPTILYRLANLYYKRKETKKATMNLMMSIAAAKPDLDRQYYLLGTILKEDGKLKEAIKNFEKSFQNNRNNHKTLYQLAITSDAYYKDKKIAYKHYKNYINKFKERDKEQTAFVLNRMKEIKQDYFLEGEIVD